MMRRVFLLLALLTGLCFARPAAALTIRLLPQAVVEPGPVQLGNIATVTGTDHATAERLANVVILQKLDAAQTKISADAVLFAVLTQTGRRQAGELGFAGAAACTVTQSKPDADAPAAEPALTLSATTPSAPAANAPATLAPSTPGAALAQTDQPSAAAADAPSDTLSSLIRDDVVRQLGARADDVRITISTRSKFLDQPLAENQRWQLRPLVRSFVGTVQYQAQLLQGTQVLQSVLVQMRVERRAQVLLAAGRIDRGQVVKAGDVRAATQWLDRAMPTLLTDADQVVDQAATRDIPAGMMIDQRDFKTVQLIKRGDKVNVYFTSAGLRLKITAMALGAAARHERVSLRNDATGEELTATVIGRDVAVVGPTPTDAAEQQLLEGP